MHIQLEDTWGRLFGEIDVPVRDTIARLPDTWETDGDGYRFRLSRGNIEHLERSFPDAVWYDPTLLRARMRLDATVRTQPGEYDTAFPFKTTPWPIQLDAFAAARDMPVFGLAPADMGVGKTKVTLDIAAHKYQRGIIDRVLIVAPNGVHRQWVDKQIPIHLIDSVRRRCTVWHGARRMPTFEEPFDGMQIFAVNVEALSKVDSRARKLAAKFLEGGRAMMVVDESSRIKNPSATRTRACIQLGQMAVSRCVLTGTPITRGLEDLYTQMRFLDPNIIGISTFTAFKARYCVQVQVGRVGAYGIHKIVGYRNVEEFVGKVAPYLLRMSKDSLGLPPKLYVERPVPLTSEQRTLYRRTAKGIMEDMRTGQLKPIDVGPRLVRLQQLLSGLYVFDENTKQSVPHNRYDAVLDVLHERPGQCVIWCRFTHEIEELEDKLIASGYKVVVYYGAVSDRDRDAAVQAFRNGDADIFIGNPQAAGTGIDGLQRAPTAIYYSNSFNAENRWQSEDRTHRGGMGESILYVDLVCEGTIDRAILSSLASKQDVANMIAANPALLIGDED